ncbi:hypothetical protein BP5796_03649 [Coleophoma crateriformis]|uniref:Major facilitator superfamily (MFS) profile domain-containing protein n=1 Tax=Coleophoma crateriformis TaxID=565419 RepID=A0A3D8SNQ5_9HELO|nr:hypothetical protein BP5796_03649 [Coleophoma crateriformis]
MAAKDGAPQHLDNVASAPSIEAPNDQEKIARVSGEDEIKGPEKFEPPELVRVMTPDRRASAERALVRKIDFRLLPMIILMYIMNYLDRNNIAAAKLAGLESDLNLTSTSVSILFVGYILMQVPSNILLNKIGKPALYLPTCMGIWGAISTATAACNSFGGLVAVRFMLGFVEAVYFPGCLYYLSCWYTRKELGLRYAFLYAGSLISGAFSGLIAAGITGNMDGLHGLRAWRWLFIIEGSITVGLAVSSIFILPNFPRTTKWLTEEEIQLATWRLVEDVGEDDWVDSEQQSLWHGAKLAFTDAKTYVLMVILFCIVSSASVTNFFPTVVQTLGFSNIITLVLTAPPYVLCVIVTMINAWHADRTGERYFHITIPLYITMAAFIIAVATTNTAARYFAMVIMVPSFYCSFILVLTWISNTLPRPPAKRAAALAGINAVSNTASIYASYMYPTSAAPRYVVAMSVNTATAFIAIIFCTILRFMLVRLNKKLDEGMAVDDIRDQEVDENGIPVVGTQRGFRYKV